MFKLSGLGRLSIGSLFIFLVFEFQAHGQMGETNSEGPLWDYGVGAGYVQFERYPASNESSHLFLVFPTFSYAGEVLRADDRDGARAYLLNSHSMSVEISGGLLPGLNSSDSEARLGMESLPWVFKLGPEFSFKLTDDWVFKAAVYEGFATNGPNTWLVGQAYEVRLWYLWDSVKSNDNKCFDGLDSNSVETPSGCAPFVHDGRLGLGWNGGSQDYLGLYFNVPGSQANSSRKAYDARAGTLNYEILFLETLHIRKYSFYLGGSLTNYAVSSNRESYLHKSDFNQAFFVGFTYVLGSSKRSKVPEDKIRGILRR